jgi:hypothetical protein
MSRVLSPAPPNFVDLFLDFQRLEIIELGFMGLELCVELVFATLFLMNKVPRARHKVSERLSWEGRIIEVGLSEIVT